MIITLQNHCKSPPFASNTDYTTKEVNCLGAIPPTTLEVGESLLNHIESLLPAPSWLSLLCKRFGSKNLILPPQFFVVFSAYRAIVPHTYLQRVVIYATQAVSDLLATTSTINIPEAARRDVAMPKERTSNTFTLFVCKWLQSRYFCAVLFTRHAPHSPNQFSAHIWNRSCFPADCASCQIPLPAPQQTNRIQGSTMTLF